MADGRIQPVVVLGKWGPPLLTLARRCASSGIPVHLIDTQSRVNHWHRLSSCLAGGTTLDASRVGTPEGLLAVRDYARSVGAGGIVAISDAHLVWLARGREAFEPQCRVMAPSAKCLEFLESKRNQIELATRLGFDVLPTWYLSRAADAAAIPARHYPIVLRPDNQDTAVAPGFKVELLRSPDEASAFMGSLTYVGPPVIAQPFRRVPNLVVHGVRSADGEKLTLHPFLVFRKFEGITLSMRSTQFPDGVERLCAEFVAAADLVGCFHFELLLCEEDRKAYYLEVNPRLGGTTDKAARVGFDEPGFTLAAYGLLGTPLDRQLRIARGVVVNKKFLLKHMAAAARGRLSALDYPGDGKLSGMARSLYELVFARDSILTSRDWRGAMHFYLRRFLR